jgi:hypothetical protein
MKKTYSKKYLTIVFAIMALLFVTCVEDHILPKFGTIFITSNPEGARINLNGEFKGQTPLTITELLSDDYNINITLNEFNSFDTALSVSENQNYDFDIFLNEKNPKGNISISTSPDTANVFIQRDGADGGGTISFTGKTPFVKNNLERGTYNVVLKKELWADLTFKIDLAKNETVIKDTSMVIASTSGGLVLTSVPSNARIFLNGEDQNLFTPDTISPLDPDNYSVTLSFEEYEDTTFNVNVLQGPFTNKHVVLKGIFEISGSVNPINGGNVLGTGGYIEGQTATLTAIPNDGYDFINWMENTAVVSTNHIYSFTVTDHRLLLANFELRSYLISVSSNPENGGSVSGLREGGAYDHGEQVSLTATPSEGFSFINWTANGSEVSKENPFNFEAEANIDLVANFSTKTYSINASVNPSNSGSITGGGNYSHGNNVTLVATPNVEYIFVNWTEDGSAVSTNASYSFVASKNRILVANFVLKQYLISADVLPANAGSVDGVGFYNHGVTATLTANANNGFKFIEWTENGSFLSDDNPLQFEVGSQRSLVANYLVLGKISVNSDPSGADIFLDDEDISRNTPYTIENLEPGQYSVKLKLNDFADTTVIADVISGVTTNLGQIYLRDITPEVDLIITHDVNPGNGRITFYFDFNQAVITDSLYISTPESDGQSFQQRFIRNLTENQIADWSYAESIQGTWKFKVTGKKQDGRKFSFEVEKNYSVN